MSRQRSAGRPARAPAGRRRGGGAPAGADGLRAARAATRPPVARSPRRRRLRGRRRAAGLAEVERCDLCGIDDPRGPPPPAAPGRAADRVLVRGVLGDARGRGRLPPGRQPHAVARRARDPRRSVGERSRSRSGSRSSWSRRSPSCVVAMYPSPAGATESELHFESWSRMVALNPVLAGLEPDVEALIVNRLADPPDVRDRADRPLLRADRHDQGALGGDLRRRRASSRRWPSFFERLRARGGGRVTTAARSMSTRSRARTAAARRPPVPEPEFAVLGARPVALRGGADADARPAGRPSRAAGPST